MFKHSLGISLDIGSGQNYLRHHSKVLYIMDTASLRKRVLTQNKYLLIIYEQVGGLCADTIEIPMSDMITFQLAQVNLCSLQKLSHALELKQINTPLLDQAASHPSVHLEGFPQHKFYYIQICELSQILRSSKREQVDKTKLPNNMQKLQECKWNMS